MKVLDARDPQGTRSKHIEQYLCKEKPHKHLIFLLNKCDLVPPWVTVSYSMDYSPYFLCLDLLGKNPFIRIPHTSFPRQFNKLIW